VCTSIAMALVLNKWKTVIKNASQRGSLSQEGFFIPNLYHSMATSIPKYDFYDFAVPNVIVILIVKSPTMNPHSIIYWFSNVSKTSFDGITI
jgi:hypothetical protein